MIESEIDVLKRRIEQLEKVILALAQGRAIALDNDGRPVATDYVFRAHAPPGCTKQNT